MRDLDFGLTVMMSVVVALTMFCLYETFRPNGAFDREYDCHPCIKKAVYLVVK